MNSAVMSRVSKMLRDRRLASVLVVAAIALVSTVLTALAVDKFMVLTSADRFIQDWEISYLSRPAPPESDIVIVAIQEDTPQTLSLPLAAGPRVPERPFAEACRRKAEGHRARLPVRPADRARKGRQPEGGHRCAQRAAGGILYRRSRAGHAHTARLSARLRAAIAPRASQHRQGSIWHRAMGLSRREGPDRPLHQGFRAHHHGLCGREAAE